MERKRLIEMIKAKESVVDFYKLKEEILRHLDPKAKKEKNIGGG